jgi:hypothetical protein
LIYFISGHGDVTDAEFHEHYVPAIKKALAEGAEFVVGDFRGVDKTAQCFLKLARPEPKVTVFHMFERPRYHIGWPTVGGFKTDEDRDAAMTAGSHRDIAWLRNPEYDTGTRRNLERRNGR